MGEGLLHKKIVDHMEKQMERIKVYPNCMVHIHFIEEVLDEAKKNFPKPTYKEFNNAEYYWLAKFQEWFTRWFGSEVETKK